MRRHIVTTLGFAAALGAAYGCSATTPVGLDGTTSGVVYVGDGGGSADGDGGAAPSAATQKADNAALDARTTDYGEALRTASLKLNGALPSLADVDALAKSKNQKAAYETAVDKMMSDVRFQERMIKWWKDVFRMGDDAGQAKGMPSRDTAPTFAARIIAEEQPFSDILTQEDNTCPTYDMTNHKFVDGDCSNGVDKAAGVLTDPGAMYQFFSHMAFRRVRWVQEIFVCTKFPAEFATKPTKVHGAEFTSPWPFDSIATGPINFQDTSSVVCANCHTSINHIAPLFANFDDAGMMKSTIQVQTPVTPTPTTTKMSDWLKDGETTHWRFGDPVKDLPALGTAMASDPDIADCAVTRAYNFAFSKGDAVTDLATVPDSVLNAYRAQFLNDGMNLKATLKKIFKSEDFTKY
jgi:hypothetical protein